MTLTLIITKNIKITNHQLLKTHNPYHFETLINEMASPIYRDGFPKLPRWLPESLTYLPYI